MSCSLALRVLRHLPFALSSIALVACAPAPRPAPPPPPQGELNLIGGIQTVGNDLARQLGPAGTAPRTLVIDPVLDARTGQQTGGSERVSQELAKALPIVLTPIQLLPFDSAGAQGARFLITGTLTALADPDQYRLSVALSDRQSGLVVAQSAAQFREAGMSTAPTRFYSDSPSLVRDRSIEGQLKTAETPAGNQADMLYIEQIPTAALLADALAAYNAERWQDALTRYEAAVQRPDGQQLRTFNGIYLCNVQLGRMDAAEQAFGKIAALGLATNNLAVKLLFKPGGTDFWSDPKVSGVYPMWLRQIARSAQAAGACMNVVGHTSRSGTEAINLPLSERRAATIRGLLQREAPGLSRRTEVSGVGSRENLVGTGADDASDALDRRVEFKVVPCGAETAHVSAAPAQAQAQPVPTAQPVPALQPAPAAVAPQPQPPSAPQLQPQAPAQATPGAPTP